MYGLNDGLESRRYACGTAFAPTMKTTLPAWRAMGGWHSSNLAEPNHADKDLWVWLVGSSKQPHCCQVRIPRFTFSKYTMLHHPRTPGPSVSRSKEDRDRHNDHFLWKDFDTYLFGRRPTSSYLERGTKAKKKKKIHSDGEKNMEATQVEFMTVLKSQQGGRWINLYERHLKIWSLSRYVYV